MKLSGPTALVRRRPGLLASAAIALAIVVPAAVVTAKPAAPPPVEIQLLNVSDWHGQLPALTVGPNQVGGAAALASYWQAERAANPHTLTLTAGDDIGATPPISAFFEDVPSIVAQRMMGIQVGTLGNHNFDRGIDHLQSMIDIAAAPGDAEHPGSPFTYVSANLRNLDENVSGVDPVRYFDLGGVKVAVIGITNEEAPTLVFPGNFGTIEITDGVAAANKFARIARQAKADVVVVITHKGVRGLTPEPFGELIDFANGLNPDLVDVVLGDHTDIQFSGEVNDILVHENRSKGLTYARTSLTVEPGRAGKVGRVLASDVEFVTPLVSAVTPDPTVSAYIADLQAQLTPILGVKLADSTKQITRADQCGRGDGRLCESLVGNVVTDAMRAAFPNVDFAITNSGGLRAALTCPPGTTDPAPSDFCPPELYPVPDSDRWPITQGTVLDVLPFGNIVVTLNVNGPELKAILEHGVSSMPGANGRFPQVSGLCFTYDVALPPGSRVIEVVRADPTGTCTTTSVDLTAGSTYRIVENDFMASGGDGYPNFSARMTTGNIMAQEVANWLASRSPISPFVASPPDGRINCVDSVAPNSCPVLVPSP